MTTNHIKYFLYDSRQLQKSRLFTFGLFEMVTRTPDWMGNGQYQDILCNKAWPPLKTRLSACSSHTRATRNVDDIFLFGHSSIMIAQKYWEPVPTSLHVSPIYSWNIAHRQLACVTPCLHVLTVALKSFCLLLFAAVCVWQSAAAAAMCKEAGSSDTRPAYTALCPSSSSAPQCSSSLTAPGTRSTTSCW